MQPFFHGFPTLGQKTAPGIQIVFPAGQDRNPVLADRQHSRLLRQIGAKYFQSIGAGFVEILSRQTDGLFAQAVVFQVVGSVSEEEN